MRKVTFNEFKSTKRLLIFLTTKTVAKRTGRHLSTIINIKGCRNFIDYEALKNSEHQPTKDSLADRVLELHKMVFMKPGVAYFAPPTARRAVIELQLKIQKDKRGE